MTGGKIAAVALDAESLCYSSPWPPAEFTAVPAGACHSMPGYGTIPLPALRAQAGECLRLGLELTYKAHVHFTRAISADGDKEAWQVQSGYKRSLVLRADLNMSALPSV